MNDKSIREKDRIYTKSRKLWCRKTTKESADRFFESLDELHEKMKIVGCNPLPPKEKILEYGDYMYEWNEEEDTFNIISYSRTKFDKIKHLFYADTSDYE